MDDDLNRFDYQGPEALQDDIAHALRSVVDPEMALSILDIGLVYAVAIDERGARVTMTMTSAACPVAEVIVEDVQAALSRVLPPDADIDVDLVWEPMWTPERMSPLARSFMGW